MTTNTLLVFIDQSNIGEKNDKRAEYRWPWTYAHGDFEADYGFDIVLFNHSQPTADGYYLATAPNNKTVIINMVADEFGTMKGRCSYVDDVEALAYVNTPALWR